MKNYFQVPQLISAEVVPRTVKKIQSDDIIGEEMKTAVATLSGILHL